MLKPAAPPPSIDNPAEAGLRQASGGGGGWAPRPRIDDAAEAVVNQAAGGGGGRVAGAGAEPGGWSEQEGAGRGGGALVRTPPVRQLNEMSAERRGRQAGTEESRGIIDRITTECAPLEPAAAAGRSTPRPARATGSATTGSAMLGPTRETPVSVKVPPG